jgi:hypothetical protein
MMNTEVVNKRSNNPNGVSSTEHVTRYLLKQTKNDRRIHIQTHRVMGGTYEVAVEMGSGVTMYIPNFMNIGSDLRKLIGGIHKHTESKVIA